MREKTWKLVVTFQNTAGALAMESFCMERQLPGRLIPVPRQISAGCGMAWCVAWEERELLGEALSRFAGQVQEQHRLWL
ncbi:MAG TPA: DUF3343 domain-containing protein [Candidatus Pullilachnospira intestinigallinarum]|nr:DUF3343 domain-containing protein [Candidatus Pullilachnospira intestinigallinarum]